MITALSPLNFAVRWTLQRLRPPSKKPLLPLESFAVEGAPNPGCSYRLQPGEPVIAAGSGQVISIHLLFPAWRITPGSVLLTQPAYEVTLDHGNSIWTVVHGLSACSVQSGQAVSRGDVLGTLVTDELFLQVKWTGTPYDPATINRHFRIQDDSHAVGRTGYVREASDLTPVSLASSVKQIIVDGIHYFVNILGSKPPVLLSIDFNGNGAYTGAAVAGQAGDYWNVYTPVDFQAVARRCFCGYDDGQGTEIGYTYSAVPYVYLRNVAQQPTATWLERIAPLTSNSGTTVTWDAMLSTWVGGYSAGIPYSSVFRFHGLPPGVYDLYLYSDQTDVGSGSDYYVQVDSGSVLHEAVNPTGATSWIQNDNYVSFTGLTLAFGSTLRIEILGFVAGMQIRRV